MHCCVCHLQYIAGKMVVVRALVAGLTLILRTPSSHPLADVETPLRFCSHDTVTGI